MWNPYCNEDNVQVFGQTLHVTKKITKSQRLGREVHKIDNWKEIKTHKGKPKKEIMKKVPKKIKKKSTSRKRMGERGRHDEVRGRGGGED